MLDFDSIDDWAPELATTLCSHVPSCIEQKLKDAKPKYIEDAQDLLFELTDRDAIIDAVLAWLRSTEIAAYHGSRLIDVELASVQAGGLQPLEAKTRRCRLVRALSTHPEWHTVEAQLDAAIQAHGPGECAGVREGQVHLTLSRVGLIDDFNHYLTYGAEFDQHVAQDLLGNKGKELLAQDGEAMVIKFAVPGDMALQAAHSIFSIEHIRSKGEVPNLANEFLAAWSYRLAHPGFQSGTSKVDCGMMFRQTVPAAWIVGVETIA